MRPAYFRIVLLTIAGISLVLGWTFIRWNLANVVALQIDPKNQDSRYVANWLTEFSPSDPRSHLLAAKVFEASFNPDDLNRSVRENELATGLSPHNYVMWLNLGRARGLIDDASGSFAAYEQALALAPNYSLVKWVYGNALIRQGRADEGFALISSAAASDPKYLGPAISIAIQIFEGQVDEVRRTMGNTATINAGLAETLMSLGRPEEAFDSWQRLSPESRSKEFQNLGRMLQGRLIELKRYRMAASVHAGLAIDKGLPVSQVMNGGFEEGVKLTNSAFFDWRISDGTHPQVGLSDGVKRSGRYGLLLAFDSFETEGFRSIDQVVAVDPATNYELEVFYRSDVRTEADLKWEVLDAATSQPLAATDAITNVSEWTPLRVKFRSPLASDGIQIRLVRYGCGRPACPMNGRVVFDDISLRRI